MKKLMVLMLSIIIIQFISWNQTSVLGYSHKDEDYLITQDIQVTQAESRIKDDIYVDDSDEEKLLSISSSYIIGHGEEFDVDFNIGRPSDVSYDYKIKFKDKEKVTFKIKIKTLGESTMPLELTKNDKKMKATLYVYSTETKDYVSLVSKSSAKRLYFQEQYELGEMKLEDYNAFVFGNDVIEEEIKSEVNNFQLSLTPVPMSSSGNIYIRGSINYEDNISGYHRAEKVRVIIYDDEPIGKTELYRGYTDSNGEYDVTIANDTSWLENGYDIIVRFEFGNDDFDVVDHVLIYNYEKDYGNDISDGTVLHSNFYFQHGSERTDALHLYQAGIIGFKHLRDISGDNSFSSLQVYYPTAVFPNSLYAFPINQINIHKTNGHSEYTGTPKDWDILLHEFGHYVAEEYDFSRLLALGHSLTENLSVRHGKDWGTELAWQEGFATYYSISSQMAYASDISVPGAGDIKYKNYNIETSTAYKYGEHNEWVISRILFDLADDTPLEFLDGSNKDLINYGDDGLFDELVESSSNGRIDTLSEFITDWYSQNPTDNLGPILQRFNVVGEPLSPSLINNLDSSTPTFSWDIGGHDAYINNIFTLKIKALDGTLLLSKNVGNTTSCILSVNEWDNLLDYETDSYVWNIEEQQSSPNSTTTGKYITADMTFQRPSATSVSQNVPKYGYLQPLDNDWYVFIPSSSGYYNVYTTGSTDTYGELSWRIVSDFSTNDIIRSDQDSGLGTNFEMRVYLYKDKPLYIRVTPGQLGNSGSYYLVVEPSSC